MFSNFQIILVGVFLVSTIVGYLIIKKVPGLLHTPLMSGMNALSGICITGALVATAFAFLEIPWIAAIAGSFAIILASINVAGGFVVTDKMLNMISRGGSKKAYKELTLIALVTVISVAGFIAIALLEKEIAKYIYYFLSAMLAIAILFGIQFMSKVEKSLLGNRFSAICMLLAILLTFVFYKLFPFWVLYIGLAIGIVAGVLFGIKVKMIQMPQLVALFNGLGGGASAIIGIFSLLGFASDNNIFADLTAAVALAIGMITLIGSLVAAGKLNRILPQKSIVIKGHKVLVVLSLLLAIAGIAVFLALPQPLAKALSILLIILSSSSFGLLFSIRVGGADMPITISLLNSLSGVAAGIAGLAIGDLLLVAVGGIVGASGLFLTQIMCKSMNRKMLEILMGNRSHALHSKEQVLKETQSTDPKKQVLKETQSTDPKKQVLEETQSTSPKEQVLEEIRSPGPKEQVLEKIQSTDPEEQVLEERQSTDSKGQGLEEVPSVASKEQVLQEKQSTDYKGQGLEEVLSVDSKEQVFEKDYDKDSKEFDFVEKSQSTEKTEENGQGDINPLDILRNSGKVIIVPGYGMAIAQAQHLVKQLADKLIDLGATIHYAVHPVAGRMPGHMNVLLCEADVDYEDLCEMDDINGEFKDADATIVVGANDVLNPAAREAEGTPIYGMPILNVDHCKNIFIFNYDLNPGYAGVENPIYAKKVGVHLFLGDAKETLKQLLATL